MSRLSTYMALPTLRGSNANGEWIKFSDGTQICTQVRTQTAINIAGGSYITITSWTYPASFISNPSLSLSVQGSYSTQLICSGDTVSTSSISQLYIRNVESTAAPLTGQISLMAIGRWYS